MANHANEHGNGHIPVNIPPLAILRRGQRDGGQKVVRSECINIDGEILRYHSCNYCYSVVNMDLLMKRDTSACFNLPRKDLSLKDTFLTSDRLSFVY